MALESPQVVAEARPGQFVIIRVTPGIDPLLRRPGYICLPDFVPGAFRAGIACG